jgi:hypothetical protein
MATPAKPHTWYERMLSIDRRWIFVLLAICVIIPAIFQFVVPVGLSREVSDVYDFMESLQPGDVIQLAIDYDPSALAELHPMSEAVLRQAFEHNARVVVTSLSQFGPAMADELITRIAHEVGKQHGVDYTFLGYKPYPAITILAMGTNYRVPYPTDYYGTPIEEIPMMEDIDNFDDLKGVIAITAGTVADFWIIYGNAKYNMPLALGVTGVMASDYYPYLQSKQIFGLIPGVKGAAEYEQLRRMRGEASTAMPYQVTAHALILVFMVITNVAYLAQRRAQRRDRERS